MLTLSTGSSAFQGGKLFALLREEGLTLSDLRRDGRGASLQSVHMLAGLRGEALSGSAGISLGIGYRVSTFGSRCGLGLCDFLRDLREIAFALLGEQGDIRTVGL